MNLEEYRKATRKQPPEKKPRTKPLPKAKQSYLEFEEDFQHALDVLGFKYVKKFQFKTTKHWRFDFLLIEYRILIEIAGGPWSGGRSGKLKNKAWSVDKYEHAEDMGYTIVRLEPATRFKINEDGPLQVESVFAVSWLKRLKRAEDGTTDKTISTGRTN